MRRYWTTLIICAGLLLGPLGLADLYHLERHACDGATPMHECPICSSARAGTLLVSTLVSDTPALILVETLPVIAPPVHSIRRHVRAFDRGPPSLT